MPWRVAKATASSLLAKLMRTCGLVSVELVQPISGSIMLRLLGLVLQDPLARAPPGPAASRSWRA